MLRSLLLGSAIVLALSPNAAARPGHGVIPHPPSTCPQGYNVDPGGVPDGCANANSNAEFQDKTFFTDYAQSGQSLTRQQPYNVDGVDYPVGKDKTATYTDPTVTPPADCTWSTDGNGVAFLSCTLTANRTWRYFDFSIGKVGGVSTPGVGTYISVALGAFNLWIDNDNFKKGANTYGHNNVSITSGTGNVTITNSSCDGNYSNVASDLNYCFLDNATAGTLTFEYNYCHNLPIHCLAGYLPSHVIRYNWLPVTPTGGIWAGNATIAGTALTILTTQPAPYYAPVPGQSLYDTWNSGTGSCGGTLLAVIDSGASPNLVLHAAPGDRTNVTLCTKAAHNVPFEMQEGGASFPNGSHVLLSDVRFNTETNASNAQPNSGTALGVEYDGNLFQQVLDVGYDSSNTIVNNLSSVNNGYTMSAAGWYASMSKLTALHVWNNQVAPVGALNCGSYGRPGTSISGFIDDGLGGGSYDGVPGNTLTVTAISNEIVLGGVFQGGTLTGAATTVTSFGTGTGVSTGTYLLSGSPIAVAPFTNGSSYGVLGTLDASGNKNLLDGSAITFSGLQYDGGQCSGHS